MMRWQLRFALVLAGTLVAVGLVGCGTAPRAPRLREPSASTVAVTDAKMTPRESMYTTSVVLSRESSLAAELKLQRLEPDPAGRRRHDLYLELKISFDKDKTYWDSNGFILAAVAATGHVDAIHVVPNVGKVRPRMLEPTGGTTWMELPPDPVAIRLLVYAGTTKDAAHKGTRLTVPISSVPKVNEFTHPEPKW